jgi:hypothetical protein
MLWHCWLLGPVGMFSGGVLVTQVSGWGLLVQQSQGLGVDVCVGVS